MRIGNQEVKEIQITDKNNVLVASIADENVILADYYQIEFTGISQDCFENSCPDLKPESSDH
jgi:hypothetical protein